ncbi:MAG: isocitrate dehydrogenase (NADP(+)) [Planctomycetota bacterium]|jgi:isocitrate dehydrogenase
MAKFLQPPAAAEKVVVKDARAVEVPSRPVVVGIVGDGIGTDIFPAMQAVVKAATLASEDDVEVQWYLVPAGERAADEFGSPLPEGTVEAIREWGVAIKGPLTTPVGGGYRSLNVTLRQVLDLYACVRPVRHYKGVPSPVKAPGKLDVVIFRENTEDVYAGIEWAAGTPEAAKVRSFLVDEMGSNIRENSAIGVKPMSEFGSKRLVRAAVRHAVDRGRKSVTLVHKGNIMKFTEGAFRDWGYAVAADEFPDETIPEAELGTAAQPVDRIVVKDRIADSMFQQVLTRPETYDVIALPNLNGDYLSDACAAQVGGLGMAPGANIGDGAALFEATHGSAPKYAGKDVVNPCSLVLSARMMLEFLGWKDAARRVDEGVEKTISSGVVTQDLARLIPGAEAVSTSEFAQAVVRAIEGR